MHIAEVKKFRQLTLALDPVNHIIIWLLPALFRNLLSRVHTSLARHVVALLSKEMQHVHCCPRNSKTLCRTFTDGQLEALMPILHGNGVFVRMAMFLAPLSVSECVMGVIISPLNGLMNQQEYAFEGNII